MARSVLGVIAGFALWSVLWLIVGAIARGAAPNAFAEDGSTQSAGILMAFLVASVICSLASGAIVAVIKRVGVVPAAVVLGVILLAVGITVQVQYWGNASVVSSAVSGVVVADDGRWCEAWSGRCNSSIIRLKR